MAQEGKDLVVTPRELDSVIAHGAALLGAAINRALQPRLSIAQLCWLVAVSYTHLDVYKRQHQTGVAVVVALEALVAGHIVGFQAKVVLDVHGRYLKLVGDGVSLQQLSLIHI